MGGEGGRCIGEVRVLGAWGGVVCRWVVGLEWEGGWRSTDHVHPCTRGVGATHLRAAELGGEHLRHDRRAVVAPELFVVYVYVR